MQVTKTSETQIQTESDEKELESALPSKKSSRKSILALSVFALGLNATAAVYTMSPSDFALPDFALPNVSGYVAELLPHERASAPIPESVVAALKDIQSAQQQHTAALQDSGSSLQQNTALLQKDAATLDTLRLSLTDEQSDVKKISAQLSTLIAKVDALQNAVAPEITSSIPKGRARARLSGLARKRTARSLKPAGPISVGGAPLTTAPAQGWSQLQSPQG
jgi:uncharacterized coiled-coil protein SlyX